MALRRNDIELLCTAGGDVRCLSEQLPSRAVKDSRRLRSAGFDEWLRAAVKTETNGLGIQRGISTTALVPGRPFGCGPSSKRPSISPTSVSTIDRPRLRDSRQSKPGGNPRPSSVISTRSQPSVCDGVTLTSPEVSPSPCSTAFWQSSVTTIARLVATSADNTPKLPPRTAETPPA